MTSLTEVGNTDAKTCFQKKDENFGFKYVEFAVPL